MKKNKIAFIFLATLFFSYNKMAANFYEKSAQLTDTQLLDKVQKDALKYFLDYAGTNSKLARERYHPDGIYPQNDPNTITSGGSGFGLMTILVGIERKFVPRKEAIIRLNTALNYLAKANRYHGAWPHWMEDATGKTIPFGTKDNGGDLVETSFLCQSLICVREYFKKGNIEEKKIAQKADELWRGVEWDWYTNGGQNVLYWHWSPNYGWEMNFPLTGYNECLITYVMAAASPTHSISAKAYHQGWARNGKIVNLAKQYKIPVILDYNGAQNNVGPMFWSQYTYLGLDPRGLFDEYANYWSLNVNQARIYIQHSINNPNNFKGYSEKIWGLTASYTRNEDGTIGYTAHQINNDNGTITPTASLSAFPYTPEESMMALRAFYEDYNDILIGVAGPYDAFSPHYNNWVAKKYLAIDQGTIVPMIENYRTGMLWNLFMNAPEVKQGLIKLGFQSTQHNF